jgi:hypothetical protein
MENGKRVAFPNGWLADTNRLNRAHTPDALPVGHTEFVGGLFISPKFYEKCFLTLCLRFQHAPDSITRIL